MKICLIGDNPFSFPEGSATLKVQRNLFSGLNKKSISTDLYVYNKSDNLFGKLFEKLNFVSDENGAQITGGVINFTIYLLTAKYDIIHFILSRYFTLPILLITPALKSKIVTTFHDNYIFPYLPEFSIQNLKLFLLKRLLLLSSNCVFIFNNSDKKILEDIYADKKFFVVKNGIDLKRYKVHEDIIRSTDVLYGGGILRKYKGYDFFYEAINIFSNKYGIRICGEGTDSRKEAQLGYLNENELLRQLQSTKILVIPSEYEPFGMLGIEAMACGTILVITANCGLAQYLDNEDGCRIIPFGDKKILIEEIIEILENSDLMKKMSGQAVAAAKRFEWEVVIKDYLKIYHELLDED